ncbi:Pps1 dual specificity phosphatase [Blastomyces dermatitidis ATCC 18188]|uniref:Pps1 dual specificity phosphatase n=1 Tax=Ajellomyces dermatitidis (strain ATCC 18188 / CBS 674.68) TaxID=653446 RepID=F2TN45_AJEDA|nr:Pps1 dual specificity phosphatase [Blastomyces dermatitidis ATCC 18188]
MMATVVVQQQPVRHSSSPPPITSALSLSANSTHSQAPVPNKHLPVCPPGPAPASSKIPTSPPASPTLKHSTPLQGNCVLYPPNHFPKLCDNPPVYSIDADTLAHALDELASRPLPDPKQVFPWLHGLHPDNHIQLGFFVSRRRSLRRIPRCLRSIAIVKAGGDLSRSRIKGAIAPEEILSQSGTTFIDADPPEGFSVRNFHIQTAKLAPLSDIIVYGEDGANGSDLLELADGIARAQKEWRRRFDPGQENSLFNTFILQSSFNEVEERHPELIAVNCQGQLTGRVMDFFHWERLEMCKMAEASEITTNVWQGPTPDINERPFEDLGFDVFIETHDVANIPNIRYLSKISRQMDDGPQRLEFPSSGSVLASFNQIEVFDLIDTCRWIYHITHPERLEQPIDSDGDIPMVELTAKPRKVLIHCGDGYTESSLLAIAYFMFAEGAPVHEAWLRLHCEKQRNFFAYPSDVTFLTSIQQRLLLESPAARNRSITNSLEPAWLSRMDGSLPSRILPYMYLGNLTHANNPELLRALGIRRILSIGESVSWPPSEIEKWGPESLMMINEVQDNGIDPLTQQFDRCLKFIEKGKKDCTATLVHCRVGVSRSATICIAEVMACEGLSFPRAYCFVRARRLNVIIQPHLRFVYELLKWDELLRQKRHEPIRRDLDWVTIAREIALMNKPYSKQQ